MLRPALALCLMTTVLVLVVPATASAVRWTAPEAATTTGSSVPGGVAIDPRGRLALGIARFIGGTGRAEVRTGTMRGGLHGASLVLDRDERHSLGAPAVGWPGSDATLAAGWRFTTDRNHRMRAGTITPGRRVVGVRELSGAGESAYEPHFVPGTSGDGLLLAWGRRTLNERSTWSAGAWGPVRVLPGEGIGALPAVAQDRDGTLVAAWTSAGEVFVAEAPAGGDFGPARLLGPDGGYARDAALAVNRDGHAVAAWVATDGTGNGVFAAARPPGATFGAPRLIDGHDAGAGAPRLAASSSGAFALAYVTTSSDSGYLVPAGVARLQTLRPDATPVGPRVRMSPDGERTREVAVADDGTSAVHAAWALAGQREGIHARRVAPGPIVGRLRSLSRRDIRAAPLIAGGQGGVPMAALAFWWNDRVYVSRYFGG